MAVLPPGTLLQLMYLEERIRSIPAGHFIEVGPGSGEITALLLEHGWTGCSYDLEEKTIGALEQRFSDEISQNRFKPVNENYLTANIGKADLVISCMVIEHLEDELQFEFMRKSKTAMKTNGRMIGLVPASPAHWGIEDDIAGHYRRYTRSSLIDLTSTTSWRLSHMAGLTFPTSNLLLPVSNFLVNRNERSKLALSTLERTKQSGRRKVKFKTHFPPILGILLNRITLFPLYLLQKLFARSKRALVLYFEAFPAPPVDDQTKPERLLEKV
jgi:SAM-dependent methyltransferase